jgi:hypothetical protein
MGVLADRYGFQAPVAAGAAVCLFFWLWLYVRRNPIRQSLEVVG